MQIKHRGQVGRITLPERIDLINAEEFKAALQSLYNRGCLIIEVDCTRLAVIDSAGLGSLVMFQKKLKERGGEIKITNVNHDHIKHLFAMIELGKIIRILTANNAGNTGQA